MSKSEEINIALKQAMRDKDKVKLEALRAIRGEIIKIEKIVQGKKLNDEEFLKIIKKIIRETQETLDIAQKNNRPEIAQNEKEKLQHFKAYLPPSLTDEECLTLIKKYIKETSAESVKDMGKVIAKIKKYSQDTQKDLNMAFVVPKVKEILQN